MTTNSTPRRFTPFDILNRAGTYEIYVALDGSDLTVEAPATLEESIKCKALEVIEAHKAAIIDYLQSLPGPPLCFTCLDEDRETPALPDDYEGIMYCQTHHPGRLGLDQEEIC